MYTIDTAKFNQTVQRLVGYIIDEQEKGTYDNPTRVDFDSGWLYKEEGYKKVIWNKAPSMPNPSMVNKSYTEYIAHRMMKKPLMTQ